MSLNVSKLYTQSPKENLSILLKKFKRKPIKKNQTADDWDFHRLKSIVVSAGTWCNASSTNYNDIDFAQVETYDKFILDDIEERLLGKIEGTNYQKNEMTFSERAFLNGIIRKAKPNVVVEIGLSAGGSTSIILNALRDNPAAKLYSFDYSTTWYRDVQLGLEGTGRKSGFLVEQIVPSMLSQWELYTGGVPCKYFDALPKEGIDLCFIDTAHFNPGEHLNILEILPFMKKNGIIIYHDIALHTFYDAEGVTNCNSINTLNGKRIVLHPEQIKGLENIGAVVLDANINNMLFPLFSNLSLPWHYKIGFPDFVDMYTHFTKYYPAKWAEIFVYYTCYYKKGGLKNKAKAKQYAEEAINILRS